MVVQKIDLPIYNLKTDTVIESRDVTVLKNKGDKNLLREKYEWNSNIFLSLLNIKHEREENTNQRENDVNKEKYV